MAELYLFTQVRIQTGNSVQRAIALSFRKSQICYFSGKIAKTKNRIFIENPPKKVLDFVMKVQKEKEEARIRLLEKKEHTFSIQM